MGKELAKKEQTSLAASDDDGLSGFEDFDMEGLVIPRLRLLQPLSEACDDGRGKPGQYENSLTNDIYDSPLELVLLSAKNGAVYMDTADGLVCKSNDGKVSIKGDECKHCPYNEYYKDWKDGEPAPKCSATIDLVVVPRHTLSGDMPHVMMMSFIKTSYKVGKKLMSMARYSGKKLYAKSYNFESVKQKNDKGTFYNFNPKAVGFLSDDEYLKAKELAETFSAREVRPAEDIADADADPQGQSDI